MIGMTDTNENSKFFGEHFEGMGAAWSAIFGEGHAGSIVEWLGTVAEEGKTGPNGLYHNKAENRLVMMTEYPDTTGTRVGMIAVAENVTSPTTDRAFMMKSCMPLLEGVVNRLVIDEQRAWANGVEGVVAAHLPVRDNEGPPVAFYAPYFFVERDRYVPETTVKVSLAAVATAIRPAERKEIIIDSGPYFEEQLREFLEENPEKTKEDFEPPVINLQGCRVLLPAPSVCEWQFRFPVQAIEERSLLGIKLYKITATYVGNGDIMIKGTLYASERVLNGYVPKLGDDVEGMLWLTGTIAE